jgi:hypothetical protein
MNFSAGKASRKWPCAGLGASLGTSLGASLGTRLGRSGAAMVSVAAVVLMLGAQAGPAAAARRSAAWSQAPWGDLFGARKPRSRRAALPASVPLPKPRPAEAPTMESSKPEPEKPAAEKRPPAEPDKPVEQAAPAPPQPSACRLALTDAIAIAPSIPDIKGAGGCGGEDLVRLEAVVLPDKRRVSVKPAAILRCAMATEIADWIRTDMVPLAASLGSAISDLDNFDSFECRGRNRVAGAKLSEHGRANALDVRGLKLANGQSISLTDRTVSRETRETVLHSVCERFSTVLGPGSDWYHEDHIHLDLMERRNNYKICQWNVWDPMPPTAPLLPAGRPEEAPPREVAAKPDSAKPDAAKSETAKPAVAKPVAAEASKPTKKRRQNRRF